MYICRCRHCKEQFEGHVAGMMLCNECMFMCRTYMEYDSLREEGYTAYQAKVMSGLADPDWIDK